jgi:CheY-like chemotaxis protein
MGNSIEIMELSDLAHIAPSEVQLSAEASLRGRRVLVVDDEAAARGSYLSLLRSAGARVTEARDGLEALERAHDTQPELIVAGVELPRLDGLGLCRAVRNAPDLAGVTVVLLGDGQPPQAMWEPETGSRPLVDALVALLRDHRLELASFEQEPPAHEDPSERENLRAQSAVAMFREPANRASRPLHPAWRARSRSEPRADRPSTEFDWQLRAMSRILGAGFLALLAGTIALIVWQHTKVSPAPKAPPGPEVEAPEPVIDTPPADAAPRIEQRVPPRGAIFEFSGVLRPTLDPKLGAGPGQGVLELSGPPEVRVVVDGIERGSLPLALVVDEGRHAVRYVREDRFTVRFYYVKAGATRVLRVVTRPGGLIDAR